MDTDTGFVSDDDNLDVNWAYLSSMVVVIIRSNTGMSVRPDRITIPTFAKPTGV
jgi:hypothetical protein